VTTGAVCAKEVVAMKKELMSKQRVNHAKWKIAGYGAAIIGRLLVISGLIFVIIEVGKWFGGARFSN
jgi:hypothetical protein